MEIYIIVEIFINAKMHSVCGLFMPYIYFITHILSEGLFNLRMYIVRFLYLCVNECCMYLCVRV